jgi:hypothetical protein
MKTGKQEIRELPETLPEDAGFEDLPRYSDVGMKVDKGLKGAGRERGGESGGT